MIKHVYIKAIIQYIDIFQLIFQGPISPEARLCEKRVSGIFRHVTSEFVFKHGNGCI